jgi:hypothetical protein
MPEKNFMGGNTPVDLRTNVDPSRTTLSNSTGGKSEKRDTCRRPPIGKGNRRR